MSVQVRLPRIEDWKAQVKCQAGCPVGTDAGRYVQLIAERPHEDAYLVARAPNPFASVCGRVCAAPCEDACRRGSIEAPSRSAPSSASSRSATASSPSGPTRRIGSSEPDSGRAIATRVICPLRCDVRARRFRRRKVAVIGAGPAGLSAAHDLALFGYDVTVFEAANEPGGMMRFGIPEYRLPRSLIRAEIDSILALGVTLRLFTPLRPGSACVRCGSNGFDAIFLSVGVSAGRDLQVPGVELDGVVKAVDYLLNINRGYRIDLGRRVVVIGGGFVAFDAARTALRVRARGRAWPSSQPPGRRRRARQGGAGLRARRPARRRGRGHDRLARDVRRDAGPAHDPGTRGVRGGAKEGVAFLTRRGPRRFLGDTPAARRSNCARCCRSSTTTAASRRPTTTRTSSALEADACILAIGQKPDLSFLHAGDGVELTPGGTIKVDPATLATTAPGVFAGGDVGVRAAEPDRGGRQRQARRAVDPRVPRRRTTRGLETHARDRAAPHARTTG